MKTELGRVVILVEDYDEAFRFYEENLGCKKFFDLTDENGKRFLHICFNSESSAGIWFVKAETDEEKKRIGNQTAGRPLLVLYTDAFEELYETLHRNEVKIVKPPETTAETIAMNFLDLYGNEIVLVQPVK